MTWSNEKLITKFCSSLVQCQIGPRANLFFPFLNKVMPIEWTSVTLRSCSLHGRKAFSTKRVPKVCCALSHQTTHKLKTQKWEWKKQATCTFYRPKKHISPNLRTNLDTKKNKQKRRWIIRSTPTLTAKNKKVFWKVKKMQKKCGKVTFFTSLSQTGRHSCCRASPGVGQTWPVTSGSWRRSAWHRADRRWPSTCPRSDTDFLPLLKNNSSIHQFI